MILLGLARPFTIRSLQIFVVFLDGQELAAVRLKALDGVGSAGWEEPQIIFGHVFYSTLAIIVDCRNTGVPAEHQDPLGGIMPMQFADAPPAVNRIFTAAMSLEIGKSSTVTCRDQPPSWMRRCADENELQNVCTLS